MADVFLSYARSDSAAARLIRDRLQALGLSVFFDTEGLDGGDVFPDVLDREVKGAGAVVGVWSAHALTRPWVKIECDIGRARGVLVPVQIEKIADLDKPAAFWNVQFDDLSDFDGDTDHSGWLRFVRSLARTLDRPDLLQRESQSHAGEMPSDDAKVRAELAALRAELEEMRSAKEQAGLSQPTVPSSPPPSPQPAPGPANSVRPISGAPGTQQQAIAQPAGQGLPLAVALLISAAVTHLVLYLLNMFTAPVLVAVLNQFGIGLGEISYNIIWMLTPIALGLVFTVLGALLARWLHYRPGIAWFAAATIGATGLVLSIGTILWRAAQYDAPMDWLVTTILSNLIFTAMVSALAGLIATRLPFFKPKVDVPGSFD